MDFTSNIEDLDEITKNVSITVANDRVQKEYNSTLSSVARTAHLKGFRKGKAPKSIIEKFLGDRIKADVANNLVRTTLEEFLKQSSLNVVGEPVVDLREIDKDKPLEFSAKLEMFPQPTIDNYKNRKVEAVKLEVSDKTVDQAIDELRERKAELKKIEDRDITKDGDVIASSVTIKVEDEEAGRPEPFVEAIGSGKLSPQIEKELTGMKVGDTKEISIVADDKHPRRELVGKNLKYTILLHGIFTKSLPELNDDFAKQQEEGVSTVKELKEKTKERAVKQAEESNEVAAHEAILNLLAEENKFKIPQSMVDYEIRYMLLRFGMLQGMDRDFSRIDVTRFRDLFGPQADKRLRCSIIIDRIAEQDQIKVTDEDRDAQVKKIADKNSKSIDDVKKEILQELGAEGWDREVLRAKVLDHLTDINTISYVVKDAGDKPVAS